MMGPAFHLDLALDSPAQNLALDEALLDWADLHPGQQVLRTWQSNQTFVVLGYGNEVAREVNRAACQQHGIPIMRRCSGGGTVLLGPGCFNFSLVLESSAHPDLQSVAGTNRFILHRHCTALASLLGRPISIQGHTDLVVDGRKFCGNAQRRGRRCLLFHGTFLLQTDLEKMSQLLPLPSRRPDYRDNRTHVDFLTGLNLPAARIRAALCQVWQAHQPMEDWPKEATGALASTKYSQDEWNFKR